MTIYPVRLLQRDQLSVTPPIKEINGGNHDIEWEMIACYGMIIEEFTKY